ncbi:hypothetical protein SAMN05421759_10639 [Roseivivax lentus]|uniref:Uncharacterized protein n=1 Tax=Roseivivax lentus TaxID=633194 RepID=A0A1N7MYP4_9RHOB|nr:hypothetical protein [Roseivivax lentus]SIS90999.1 hypothetical protein SAMN05421759_10639 [Roseivivax lentus]
MGAFEPDPALIALIFVKRFVYFELLFALALTRVILARGAARWVAAAVLALAALCILTTFAPALGLQEAAWYAPMAHALSAGQGLRVPLALSALFFVSGVVPTRARRWIDALHVMFLLGFLGLWGSTLM